MAIWKITTQPSGIGLTRFAPEEGDVRPENLGSGSCHVDELMGWVVTGAKAVFNDIVTIDGKQYVVMEPSIE